MDVCSLWRHSTHVLHRCTTMYWRIDGDGVNYRRRLRVNNCVMSELMTTTFNCSSSSSSWRWSTITRRRDTVHCQSSDIATDTTFCTSLVCSGHCVSRDQSPSELQWDSSMLYNADYVSNTQCFISSTYWPSLVNWFSYKLLNRDQRRSPYGSHIVPERTLTYDQLWRTDVCLSINYLCYIHASELHHSTTAVPFRCWHCIIR